jgi:hypothetical protein
MASTCNKVTCLDIDALANAAALLDLLDPAFRDDIGAWRIANNRGS